MYWLIGCKNRLVDGGKYKKVFGVTNNVELLDDETLEYITVTFKEFMKLGNACQVIGYTGVIGDNKEKQIAEIIGKDSNNRLVTNIIEGAPPEAFGVGIEYTKRIPIMICGGAYVISWNRRLYKMEAFMSRKKELLENKMFYTTKKVLVGGKVRMVAIWLDVEPITNTLLHLGTLQRTGYNTVNKSAAKLAKSLFEKEEISKLRKKQSMIGAKEIFDMAVIDGLVHFTGAGGKPIETDKEIKIPPTVDVIDRGAIASAPIVYIPENVKAVNSMNADTVYGLKYETIVFDDVDKTSRIYIDREPVRCKIGELVSKGINTYTMPANTKRSCRALSGIVGVENVLYKYPRKVYNDTNWSCNETVKCIGIVNDKPFTIGVEQFYNMKSLERVMIKGSGYIEALRDRAFYRSDKLNINELDLSRCTSFGAECFANLTHTDEMNRVKITVDVNTTINAGAFMLDNIELHLKKRVFFKSFNNRKRSVYEINDNTDDDGLIDFINGLVYSDKTEIYMNVSRSLIDRLNNLYRNSPTIRHRNYMYRTEPIFRLEK